MLPDNQSIKKLGWPWLMLLSELSTSPQTKRSPVQFPVRAHAWVAGQAPSRGPVRGKHTLMFLSFSFSLPPLCWKINKILKKKQPRMDLINIPNLYTQMNAVSSKVISLRSYTSIPMMVLILKTFLDSSFRISIKV